MKLRDIDRYITEADHEGCQTIQQRQTTEQIFYDWKAMCTKILGKRFFKYYDVTDVDERAPTSNRANPYWHGFGFGCGSWNKDIVLKSGGSDERPNGSGRPPP